MNSAGVVFFALSWALVIGLTVYCFVRVMRTK